MRTIYKYDIVAAHDSIIEGPITKLLTAQIQNGTIVVWAEVDTEGPNRKFEVFPIGTGWPLDPPLNRKCVLDTHTYLSTVQFAGGSLIFHIYYAEITPKPVKENPPMPVKKAEARKEYAVESVTMINPEILKVFTN